jgi:hypothetical protein
LERIRLFFHLFVIRFAAFFVEEFGSVRELL